MTDLPHRQRPWRLCLSWTLSLPFPLFLYMQIYTRTIPDVCFPSLSLITFQSRQPHRDRYNRFFSILSRHIFCLLMMGHQPFSSLNYLCSEAGALSHFVLTGLSISRTNERERMRMKMWLTVWTQTESSIFTHSSKRSSRGTRWKQFGSN